MANRKANRQRPRVIFTVAQRNVDALHALSAMTGQSMSQIVDDALFFHFARFQTASLSARLDKVIERFEAESRGSAAAYDSAERATEPLPQG
jgi:hypothetical protein